MSDAANKIDLNEPRSLPETFTETHYSHYHAMVALNVSEPEFWALYTSRQIPPGVNLMPLCGFPFVVWPKRILDEWNRTGRPAEPGALELQSEVLHALIEAYEAEGVEFPTYDPVVGEELN